MDDKFSRFSYLPKLTIKNNFIFDSKIYFKNKLLKFEEIKKAENLILKDKLHNKEYVPIFGDPNYCKNTLQMLFEFNNEILKDLKYLTYLSFSRGGGLSSIFNLIKKFYPSLIYVPKLKNPIYREKILYFNLFWNEYDFFKFNENYEIDFDNLCKEINNIDFGSFIILPMTETDYTGYTLTNNQWEKISKIIKFKKLIPIFDIPYQGWFSNNIIDDTYPLIYFKDTDFIIIQNLDYNFGLYSERIGCIHIFSENKNIKFINSQMDNILRTMYCNPHKFGPSLINKILSDKNSKINHLNQLSLIIKNANKIKEVLNKKLIKKYFNIQIHKGIYIKFKLPEKALKTWNDKINIYPGFNGILNLSLVIEDKIEIFCNHLNNN